MYEFTITVNNIHFEKVDISQINRSLTNIAQIVQKVNAKSLKCVTIIKVGYTHKIFTKWI